jgi:hypothetical protein
MHVSCVPDDSEDRNGAEFVQFGWAVKGWPGDAGTQLVASGTMQHLSVECVAALGDFCQWHLSPYLQRYQDEGGDAKAAAGTIKPSQRVLNEINEEKWTEFLAQWNAEKEDVAAALARGTPSYTLAKASSGLERMGVTEDDYRRLTSIFRGSMDDLLDLCQLRLGDE